MTSPRTRPFGPDVVVAVLLAVEWILVPVVLFGYALVAPPGPDPAEIGMEKNGFLWFLAPVAAFFLTLFGWICLRVRDGRQVGLIAAAVVQGVSLVPALIRGGPGIGFALILPIAILLFVVARFRGWGPRPS